MSASTETIAFLANYNSWRRGDETLEMPSPAEIGATIDDAVNLLRKYDDLKARAERAEHERDQLRAELATCKDASEGLIGSLRAEVERWELAFQEQYARAERAEAELKEWSLLNLWGDTPEIIHGFIKGQQARIHAAQNAEAELAAEREKVRVLREACSHLSYVPRIQRALHKTEEPAPRV